MRYAYRAYDESGRLIAGEIAADSREAALNALHRRGEFPIEVVSGESPARQRWWNHEIVLIRRITTSGLALFTREMAILVKAGLPLDETLRIAALQPALSPPMRRIAENLLTRVLEGQSLSQAMGAEAGAFPEYYWRLVRGGEASGSLAEALDDLARFLERSADLRAKIASALLYPAILLTVAVLTVIAIMTILLPAIVPLLRDAGAPLPFIVQALDDVRGLVAGHPLLWIGATAALAISIAVLLITGAFMHTLSHVALRLPVIRGLVTKREVARFSRTLGTLMKNGVPMLEALRISSGVLTNRTYRSMIEAAAEEVRQGAPLIRPLSLSGHFPEIALRLIAVGEKTAQLEPMLSRVADIFEASLQRQLDRTAALIAPVLTIAIGALVGGLIVSVMSALLSINELAIN